MSRADRLGLKHLGVRLELELGSFTFSAFSELDLALVARSFSLAHCNLFDPQITKT